MTNDQFLEPNRMTYREQFQQIMHYGAFDRMPVCHWGTWPQTQARWYAEGMPREMTQHEFLGANRHWHRIPTNLKLFPEFEEIVYEETEEYKIFRDAEGVVSKQWKHQGSIPHYLDFILKDASGWDEYKKRLQPDPARIPADLDKCIAAAQASGHPLEFETTPMMGWIRNWMGVENMSYLMYDDPEVYADMVMTLADLTCWGMDQVLPKVQVDLIFGWEDICGRSGPLVSPSIFEKYVAPGYRKIRAKAEQYGVKLYGVDCDGDITNLAGHWLDAGVNFQFPIEVGVWKGDARKYRKQYGRELRIFGNLDKYTLEQSHAAVLAELERLRPLMEDGGFIVLPDHGITPGVALDDYRWYLDQVRKIRL